MNHFDDCRMAEIFVARINRANGIVDKPYPAGMEAGRVHLLRKNGKYRAMEYTGKPGRDVFEDHETVDWFPGWMSLKSALVILELFAKTSEFCEMAREEIK